MLRAMTSATFGDEAESSRSLRQGSRFRPVSGDSQSCLSPGVDSTSTALSRPLTLVAQQRPGACRRATALWCGFADIWRNSATLDGAFAAPRPASSARSSGTGTLACRRGCSPRRVNPLALSGAEGSGLTSLANALRAFRPWGASAFQRLLPPFPRKGGDTKPNSHREFALSERCGDPEQAWAPIRARRRKRVPLWRDQPKGLFLHLGKLFSPLCLCVFVALSVFIRACPE